MHIAWSKKVQSKSVIIVDDESAARKNLRKVIDTFPELEVIAEVDNGQTAISQIEALKPDILFLDIENQTDLPEEAQSQKQHLPQKKFHGAENKHPS